jgi:hypothetical protein
MWYITVRINGKQYLVRDDGKTKDVVMRHLMQSGAVILFVEYYSKGWNYASY